MNKTSTKLLVLAILVITSFSACVKGLNEPLTVNKDNMVATYTIVSMKASAPGIAETDITSDNYSACEMDDQVVLRSDLSATFVDAGMQCSNASGGAGLWDLYGNTFTLDGTDYNILTLTRSNLVIQRTTIVSNVLVTLTYTYRRY